MSTARELLIKCSPEPHAGLRESSLPSSLGNGICSSVLHTPGDTHPTPSLFCFTCAPGKHHHHKTIPVRICPCTYEAAACPHPTGRDQQGKRPKVQSPCQKIAKIMFFQLVLPPKRSPYPMWLQLQGLSPLVSLERKKTTSEVTEQDMGNSTLQRGFFRSVYFTADTGAAGGNCSPSCPWLQKHHSPQSQQST